MLHFQNYRKAYNHQPVLQVEELQLPSGLYWLKGENGTGKTTLLKSVAGLLPFEGNIAVNGISLRKQRRPYTRDVSFSEAEPVFPSFLTGSELLRFFLQTKGGDKQRANEIAEALGMTSYLSNRVGTYSSGMLKKLSLLLSFSGQPSLLLLDEPFTTLDAEAAETLQHLIVAAYGDGTSFLISSHHALALTAPHQSLWIRHKTVQHEAYVAGA